MKVFPRARRGYVLSLALCALLLVALALPAAAARPAGKGKPAKADKASTTQVTEDNDTNDGGTPNNVADDGDNRHPSGKDRSVEKGGSGNQGRSGSDPDDDGRGPDRSNGGADKPGGPGGDDLADQDGNNGCGNDDDFEDDNEGWCGRKPKPERPAVDEPKPEPEPGDSCTPGTAGCDEDTDEPSCTPGTVGCDEGDSCSGDLPECTDGGSDSDSDVDVIDTPDLNEGPDAEGDDALGSDGEVEGETDVAGVVVERPSSPLGGALGGGGALGNGVARVAGAASAVLAATGLPTVLLGLLALAGIGAGAGMVRRTRKS